jgi:hypothetical protein
MLTRSIIRTSLALLAAGAFVLVAEVATPPAYADGGNCSSCGGGADNGGGGSFNLHVTYSGSSVSSGGGGSVHYDPPGCWYVDVTADQFKQYAYSMINELLNSNYDTDQHRQFLSDSLKRNDELLANNPGGTGIWYIPACGDDPAKALAWLNSHPQWIPGTAANRPAGFVDVNELAQDAHNHLQLPDPAVTTSPDPLHQVTQLPTNITIAPPPAYPATVTAQIANTNYGVTVTGTLAGANLSAPGGATVVNPCKEAGNASFNGCSITYHQPSTATTFTVSATWQVGWQSTWAGGGVFNPDTVMQTVVNSHVDQVQSVNGN